MNSSQIIEDTVVRVVYILGGSFSGSTILSFLIGAGDRVENLGELKNIFRYKDTPNQCTCGTRVDDCLFWRPIIADGSIAGTRTTPFMRGLLLLSACTGVVIPRKRKASEIQSKSLHQLTRAVRAQNPRVKYVLDNSKSLWRLDLLRESMDIDLKVIYIQRDIKSNVASFVRRQKSFVLAVCRYLVNHAMIRRYLKRNRDLDCACITYDELVSDPDHCLRTIGKLIGVDLSNNTKLMNDRVYHVFRGNSAVRKSFETFARNIDRSRNYESVSGLNMAQTRLLDFLGRKFQIGR